MMRADSAAASAALSNAAAEQAEPVSRASRSGSSDTLGILDALLPLGLALIREARWRLAGALGLMIAFSLTEGVGVLLLFPLLQVAGLDLTHQGEAGRFAATVTKAFAAIGLYPSLPILLAIFVVLIGARTLLSRMQSDAMFTVEQQFETAMRLELYRAISRANWSYVALCRSSDFAHALSSELSRTAQAAFEMMVLGADLILTGLYLLIALRLAPAMTAIVLGCGTVLIAALRNRTRQVNQAGEDISISMNSLFAAMSEHLGNLKLAKAYAAEDRNYAMFESATHAVQDANLKAQRAETAASAWFELGSAIILGSVLYIAIRILAVPPAAILILLLLFARVMPRFLGALQKWHLLVNAAPAFVNLTAMRSRFEAASEPEPSEHAAVPQLRREIRLAGVSFSYGKESEPVLRDVNLAVPAGRVVALVGSTGAGKSTIADLIMGLAAPSSGRITVDDVALDVGVRRKWRERIGYAASDTVLFHGSVRSNLCWANPDASDAEIHEALERAAAREFVAAMAAGIDTAIGDRGATLSQGERQRIAIARALLRRPALLVLDEATNGLDSATEARMLDALESLRGRTTVLMIAHRLSTIRWADLIYVIENGRVVECGDWKSLLARAGGRFRALCDAQALSA